ncbi:MAG TPA: ornithine cyclodeaminase family protein [Candidatus Limnocylindrales bacterium]|nr:ornithine cyclodeaminase family protein [Candidatus Limnocylindrales bacterium]
MADLLYLSRAEVERLLDIDSMLDALANAFVIFSSGKTSVPPRIAARASEHNLLGAMAGYVPGVALESKLVSVFPANDAKGIPSHQGLIALFDEETGTPIAVMDGTYITAIRTGGAAAVATRLLARDDARVLAILGAGAQGWSHLQTFPRVRQFSEIRIASRNPERANELANLHPAALGVASFEDAVRGADVVACCTDARAPILSREWLQPGTHLSAVGGTFGRELDRETVDACSVFVEWRGAVTNPPPAGAHELQGLDPEKVTEIGEVVAGTKPGRRSADEMTLYKSTGHAVEDAATARLVYDRALAEGAGVRLPL